MKFTNQLDTNAVRFGGYKRSGIERTVQSCALGAYSQLNGASVGLF